MATRIRLMGILNTTPDSFYDLGHYFGTKESIAHGIALAEQGADLIDIGGESTRPGASSVDVVEEKQRVLPVIKTLVQELSIPLSIDTMKWEVAAAAVDLGVHMINDVSGFSDPEMRSLAASSDVELCVMHMQGNPQTMQKHPHYPEGVVAHLIHWFRVRVEELLASGVKSEKIYLDPGIGFGKSVVDNFEIIAHLEDLRALGFPICIGASRKSFMGKVTHRSSAQLLPETLLMNSLACMRGADMIRIHDVADHRAILTLMEAFSLQSELSL